MFNLHHKSDLLEIERYSCALTEANAKLAAVSRSMAMIEFTPDGIVLDANDNFCNVMGYSAEEVRGKHHRIFCEEAFYRSEAYAKLWRDLARGEPVSGTFLRLNKSGKEIWLEASYMPVIGADRQVSSVIKVATDISDRINKEHENESMLAAIGRSMAMIEFTPEGNVITANENFLKTTHYALNEIVGQHHSLFCHRAEAESPSYKAFWASLNRGEYHSHRFERRDKHGHTIYLEASYNPLFDANGRLYKVVKFASDITQQVTTLQTAAESAHSTSVQNDACAQKGSQVVQQTVQIIQDISKNLNEAAMSIDAVSKQSDIIGTIVQTIRGIADQTNLLALNAA
ncbi:PAS domain-containing protein, partial [Pseudomonas fluorescens]